MSEAPPAKSRPCPARLALTALLFAHGLFAQTPAADHPADNSAERLPTTVVPLRYDLHLHPDAEALAFSGDVQIDIQVRATVPEIVLNARDLVFDDVTLDAGRRASVTLDTPLEQASLKFAGGVPPGAHSLRIRYHGAITHATLGFFAMDYESPSGKRRTLATNLEPAAERMLMPSWDEPQLKATFRVTVDAPADRMVVANMPAESETPLPNKMKRVRFAPTPKMATYLLFLAIGDFERVSENVDGVQVGVVVAKGGAERGRYALGQAARLMRYYNDYFGVHYPLPKLDLVAAPGEIEGGSMENWGAIFYSQKHILFDSKNSTENDRRLVFLVVSHEMAHQWFGDLVTMSWWDDLWLNEGFARWMQTKAADDLNPQWKAGLLASSIVEQGMRADAKASTHPIEQPIASAAEAELAFDEITYDKGASVIGMLESYLGADRFRDGVRSYMRKHAYGNTVSADLWQALQAAASKPVQGIAEDFTLRSGLPLVSVELERPESGGGVAQLSQSRFLEAHRSAMPEPEASTWRLPLAVKSVEQTAASDLMLDTPRAAVSFAGSPPAIVNAGRKSYARVRYEPGLFAQVVARMGSLAPSDQIGILQDSWALGISEYAPITNFLSVVDAIPPDADPIVWLRAVSVLETLDQLYAGLPAQAAYREWARSRLAPLAERYGWDEAPGQPQGAGLLRAQLLAALGRFGDPKIIAEARRREAAASVDASSESQETRRVARKIVARNASQPEFDQLVEKLHAIRDPLEKQDLLEAMTGVADPKLAAHLLEIVLGPDVPAGSMPYLLSDVANEHPDLAWSFALSRVDAPGFVMDRATRMEILPHLPARSAEPRRAEELRTYAAAHLPAAASRAVESAVAEIELNARARAVELPQVDEWLKREHRPARPL